MVYHCWTQAYPVFYSFELCGFDDNLSKIHETVVSQKLLSQMKSSGTFFFYLCFIFKYSMTTHIFAHTSDSLVVKHRIGEVICSRR